MSPVSNELPVTHEQVRQNMRAIFPLLLREGHDFTCVGTAFFVAAFGIFVTAKHVVAGTRKSDERLVGLPIAHNGTLYIHDVEDVVIHPEADIAIGRLSMMVDTRTGEPLRYNRLCVTSRRIDESERIATFAFPEGRVDRNGERTMLELSAKAHDGRITGYHELTRGPRYSAELLLRPGASGGPVMAAADGAAFAVNTSSIVQASGEQTTAFLTPISEAMDLSLTDAGGTRCTLRELVTLP